MSEIPNDHIQDNPKTLDKINNSSESFTNSLENIEDKLNIDKDDLKVSDDVRAAYLKINSLSRAGPDNSKLEGDYSKIMDKYSELSSRSYESQQEYLEATKQLLLDLSTLELSSGEKLSDKSIDGGLFEAAIALKEGIIKAGETIYEELKGYFEMIGMVGDLPEIIEKIVGSLSFDTLTDIYKALVDMGGDTIRDFSLILKNSTGMGKAVELSHFVPSVGIPLLFDSVGPGKFFKILKIDKFIPEKALKAMGDIKDKGADALGKTFHKAEKADLNPAEKIGDKVDDLKEGLQDVVEDGTETIKEEALETATDTIKDTATDTATDATNEVKNTLGEQVTNSGYDSETIRNNFSIKDNETRKIAAVDTLTQKYGEQFKGFTKEQLDGIIEAHEIGKELFTDYLQKHGLESVDQLSDTQLKEIFNSKEGRIALRQKMKKLKEAGVDMKYSDDLIRAGVTGGETAGETANLGIRIMSEEALKDLQGKARNIIGNVTKLPEIGQRIKSRSLSENDIKILDDLLGLAKSGHLSKEHVNKTVIEVIEKAKLGETHPAMEMIFNDFNSGKIKLNKLENIKSGDISKIAGFGTIDDLYKSIDNTLGDINLSEKLDQIDGFINIDANEIGIVSQTMKEILKLDFDTLLNNGVNMNSIKPIQFLQRYGGLSNPEVNYKVGVIVKRVANGAEISAEDVKYLKDNLRGIIQDDKLINISKGNLEKAKLVAKKELASNKIHIPDEEVSKFGAYSTIQEIEGGLMSLQSYGNNGLRNLVSDSNKSILKQLIELKDNLWDKVSDVNGLKKELHNNPRRNSLLRSIGLENDDIDLLDKAALI
ncbi:MAG: hypothetical protein PHS49_04740 [Candidatus Gracilibacteria bacterium]|nr:hypothetical protein [Candidatus Gracilibacteria bacterium]